MKMARPGTRVSWTSRERYALVTCNHSLIGISPIQLGVKLPIDSSVSVI